MPFETKEHEVTSGERKYNPYAHSFAGMGVQFILFLGIDLGIGVLLMRRMDCGSACVPHRCLVRCSSEAASSRALPSPAFS